MDTDEQVTVKRHYLKEWREFRQMTQEQLAEHVDTSKGVISLLENFGRSLSDKWARRLAKPLKVQPGWLLDYDPNNIPTDVMDLWAAIPDEDKPQAQSILETFTKKTVAGA